jgi:hypothetical protein
VPTLIAVTVTPATQLLSCYGDTKWNNQATLVSGGQGTNYLYTLNYLSLTPVVSSGPQADPIFTGLEGGLFYYGN